VEVGGTARARAASAESRAAVLLAGEAAAKEGLRLALVKHEEGLARVRANAAVAAEDCEQMRHEVATAETEIRRRGEALERLRNICAASGRRCAKFEADFDVCLAPAASAQIDAQMQLRQALDAVGLASETILKELFASVHRKGDEAQLGLEALDGLCYESRALLNDSEVCCTAAAAAAKAAITAGLLTS
jgi:hypothetical protein